MVDYSAVHISAFVFTLLFVGGVISFLVMNQKINTLPNSVTASDVSKKYYYIGGGLILVAIFIIELMAVFRDKPTEQVRLSAIDLMAMIAWIYFSTTIYIQDKRYIPSRRKSIPQLILYATWALTLVIVGLDLTIFIAM